jgi:hypothetical protein
MLVTRLGSVLCECGAVMPAADRPFDHLVYCGNPRCKQYGIFYEIPTFELKPGRAFSKALVEAADGDTPRDLASAALALCEWVPDCSRGSSGDLRKRKVMELANKVLGKASPEF